MTPKRLKKQHQEKPLVPLNMAEVPPVALPSTLRQTMQVMVLINLPSVRGTTPSAQATMRHFYDHQHVEVMRIPIPLMLHQTPEVPRQKARHRRL